MNQTVCKLRENKVTILRPRNGARQARAPLEFGTTKIGAEDSECALLASQGPSLRAKEPRKDSPPAAPEAWTGWPDRQGRQGAKPITEKKEWARDQWVLRNARAEVTPPNCQAAHCGRGPKARGRGGPGGGGKKVPGARDWGRRRRGRQRPTAQGVVLAAVRPNPRYRGPSRPKRKG